MTRRLTVGSALLSVLLVAAACSSPSGDGVARPTRTGSPAPSGAAESARSDCPQLAADVPDDLDTRRIHKSKDASASTGVIWTNDDSTRVVNVASAASNEPVGDGTSIEPVEREVQGTTGTEIVNGDVHAIYWQQPGSEPCPFWSVVVQGLSEGELDAVLDSVREK